MISNNHSFLKDKDYWVDPEQFRPERFIDAKGNFVNDERVALFGFGKINTKLFQIALHRN